MTTEQKLREAAQKVIDQWERSQREEKYDECVLESFSKSRVIDELADALSLPPTQAEPVEGGEVVAWVRQRSDGGYEGPLLDSDPRMDDTRRKFWIRLSSATHNGLALGTDGE